jgi:hypothetical protein
MSEYPFDPDFIPDDLRHHPDLLSSTPEKPPMIATKSDGDGDAINEAVGSRA